MEKKQTAVEWLQEPLLHILTHEQQMQVIGLFHQALAMEKEQLMKAVYDSMGTNFDPNMGRAELYYNTTYGETEIK